ncbi:hypothetical protein [Natranaerofaba carboxydovora]|uniref:hypothetical protein n=1 Tax=Natranaerofaba carboxydovora TaxID=2742683 RepID=UPI001F132F53|nr:hypothetical protein [Natranaerofaba carboxydovora]UMZ74315.1 hypothetical protein ACONDI_01903 [Natranaerofaba carboxydovora]
MWSILLFLLIFIFVGWAIMVTYSLHNLDTRVKNLENILENINNEVQNKTTKSQNNDTTEE